MAARSATVRPDLATRAAAGRAARDAVPLDAHAGWSAPPDRDPVAILEEQALTRVAELVPIRHGRMLLSPFAFYRGAAAVMASDLAETPRSGLRVQACGDAHVLNFGAYAAPDRRIVFDLNDFDETFPGPWEWDVKRLAASIEIAMRERGLKGKHRRRTVAAAMRQYRTAMLEFAAMGNVGVWYSRLDGDALLARFAAARDPGMRRTLRKAEEKAHRKDSLRAVAKLTERVDGRARIVSDPPLVVPLTELVGDSGADELEGRLDEIVESYRRSLPSHRRALLDTYRCVDMARKVVGVGSVGTRTWIVLLEGRDAGDPLVLQAKEAQRSVLAPYVGERRAAHEGRRVVEGQRLMQAAGDIFLGWDRQTGIDGRRRDFYVRQLWDGKFAPDVARMPSARMQPLAVACAWTLARAHARSGDRVALAAYLGKTDAFERALVAFAAAYADQNERDHAALANAVRRGRVTAQMDV